MSLLSELGRFSSQTALIGSDGVEISYSTLVREVARVASIIKPRELVFLHCANNIESVVFYLGVLNANAIPVLLDDGIPLANLTALIDCYQPSYAVVSSALTYALQGKELLVAGDRILIAVESQRDYEISDELAQLMTTSGSTGSPKFVRQTEENLRTNSSAIRDYLGITPGDRAITTLPMSYSYGLSIINSHLISGASIVMNQASVTQKDFWKLLNVSGANNFGGVPYLFDVLGRMKVLKDEFKSLRYITQAGGKLAPQTFGKMLEICNGINLPLVLMYGQTEASPRMSYLPPEMLSTKGQSIGVPLPGGKFWLKDERGRVVKEHNHVGELHYSGRNVVLGYAESRIDLIRGDDFLGELATGDLARCDEDGYYYVVGRRTRFLKIHGHRVNLDHLEEVLGNNGFFCVCTGDDKQIDIVVEGHVDRSRIINCVTGNTNLHQSAFSVSVVKTLPRSVSGKLIYRQAE